MNDRDAVLDALRAVPDLPWALVVAAAAGIAHVMGRVALPDPTATMALENAVRDELTRLRVDA